MAITIPVLTTVIALTVALLAAPPAADAQQSPRAYVGALLGSQRVDADAVDGSTSALGITAGIRLTRLIGLEVEVGRPSGIFSREYTGTSISFAPPGSSREEIERMFVLSRFRHDRKTLSSVSAGIVIRGPVYARWSPRVFVGVTNHHVLERSSTDSIRIPEGVDPEQVKRMMPDQERTRDLGGLTVGGGAAFALSRHVAIEPDLRFDYGSIGDEINNVLRTSVRAVWSF